MDCLQNLALLLPGAALSSVGQYLSLIYLRLPSQYRLIWVTMLRLNLGESKVYVTVLASTLILTTAPCQPNLQATMHLTS